MCTVKDFTHAKDEATINSLNSLWKGGGNRFVGKSTATGKWAAPVEMQESKHESNTRESIIQSIDQHEFGARSIDIIE